MALPQRISSEYRSTEYEPLRKVGSHRLLPTRAQSLEQRTADDWRGLFARTGKAALAAGFMWMTYRSTDMLPHPADAAILKAALVVEAAYGVKQLGHAAGHGYALAKRGLESVGDRVEQTLSSVRSYVQD